MQQTNVTYYHHVLKLKTHLDIIYQYYHRGKEKILYKMFNMHYVPKQAIGNYINGRRACKHLKTDKHRTGYISEFLVEEILGIDDEDETQTMHCKYHYDIDLNIIYEQGYYGQRLGLDVDLKTVNAECKRDEKPDKVDYRRLVPSDKRVLGTLVFCKRKMAMNQSCLDVMAAWNEVTHLEQLPIGSMIILKEFLNDIDAKDRDCSHIT